MVIPKAIFISGAHAGIGGLVGFFARSIIIKEGVMAEDVIHLTRGNIGVFYLWCNLLGIRFTGWALEIFE